MSRKPDGTQRSGRFTAPPASGAFGGSDTSLSRLARPFVPKPFRSTGGMSTSADTMMSIGMGRHNVEEELPDDQINIASIVSSKTSDRRYLPRKLKSMQMYLSTVPISELLDCDGDSLLESFEDYENMIEGILDSKDSDDRDSRKKKKRTDEFSGAGAVAGYTGPLAGPVNPRKFYNTMANVAGSKYLLDPLKASKQKP